MEIYDQTDRWWAACPIHGKHAMPSGSCHECAMLQPKPTFHARLKLTWVRQTERSHIYEIRFPDRTRCDTIAIPKFTRDPNYCLPTTKPPKELECEIREKGEITPEPYGSSWVAPDPEWERDKD